MVLPKQVQKHVQEQIALFLKQVGTKTLALDCAMTTALGMKALH